MSTPTLRQKTSQSYRFMDDSARMGGYIIEPMRRADLPEVLAIEGRSFATPWSRAAFEAEMEKTYGSLSVARLPGSGKIPRVLGYVCFWLVADEVQIANLAVHVEYRRRGVGRSLLLHACVQGSSVGARLAVLEVRESNKGARALYEKVGFAAVHKRTRYYRDFREDGLIMVLSLPQRCKPVAG